MAQPRPSAPACNPPAPDYDALHDAALAYLGKYAATKAMLERALERRIERWARTARSTAPENVDEIASQVAALRRAVREIVARLAASGALDDAAWAASRTRRLFRAGQSRRAVEAHLMAKGIDAATARAALPANDQSELSAALALARRRRIGPFREKPPNQAGIQREMAILARAGFTHTLAAEALGMDAEEAEALLRQLRQP
jgi:regulatory protein